MNVLFFWEKSAGGITLHHRCNPYAGILHKALRSYGVNLEAGNYDHFFSKRWLKKISTEFDIIHLNWLHYFYRRDNFQNSIQSFIRFVDNLTFAQSLGFKIVWTLHNLYPHERPFPQLDRLARLFVAQVADNIVVHGKSAKDLVREYFYRSERIHVIPHTHFIDVYPNSISPEKARQQLGLKKSQFVYLFFGKARAYKGIENLIQAFGRICDKKTTLILMMQYSATRVDYVDELQKMTRYFPNIRVYKSPYFSNDEFQIYANASNVAVLPFTEVLTSGSVITALSFGLPVITPDIGCLPELITNSNGLTYDPKDKRGLERCLREIRTRDVVAMGDYAFQMAKTLDPNNIAQQWANLYHED